MLILNNLACDSESKRNFTAQKARGGGSLRSGTAKTAVPPAEMTAIMIAVKIKKEADPVGDTSHSYLASIVANELWAVKRFLHLMVVQFPGCRHYRPISAHSQGVASFSEDFGKAVGKTVEAKARSTVW